MIYKYLSIQNIIEKIYRDYGSPEELDVWDLYEWIAEALEAIDAYPQYEKLFTQIPIENWKGKLPCNLSYIEQVSYCGKPCYPVNSTMAILSSDTSNTTAKAFIRGEEVTSDMIPLFAMRNTDLERRYYDVDDCNLFFDIQTVATELVVSYIGVKIDQDGLPMIPDNYWYREAVTSYVQKMLDRIEWRKQKISEAVYRDSERAWERAKNAARANALMPDLGKMENLKNQIVRLKPNIRAFDSFFSSHSLPENLR